MIGNTDLFSFLDENGKEKWEIAYDLDPAHWGKGLGRGMIGFLVQWAGWLGVDVVTAVSLLLLLCLPFFLFTSYILYLVMPRLIRAEGSID